MDVQLEIAKRTNLIDLIGNEVQLRRESRDEWSGPCPLCGGTDRLHVRHDSFFCRNCRPEFGDAIDYARWRHNLDFRAAVAFLAGGVPEAPRAAKVKPTAHPSNPGGAAMADDIDAIVERAQAQIAKALPYLLSRGISEESATMYRLGYRADTRLPGTKGQRTAPAIVIPWYRGDRLAAVRYRFLEIHQYTDIGGKPRTARLVSEYGSDLAGLLYGGHVLPEFCRMPIDDANGRCAEQLRTLVLVEGELNAISIWQVASGWNWDVLSLGSESQKLSAHGREFANRYGRIMVWMDRLELGKRLALHLSGAYVIEPPVANDKALDANDLLVAGTLDEFLADMRIGMCSGDERELNRILYQTGRL